MTLRRRRKKDVKGELINNPVRCGICKKEETLYTVHGGIATGKYGGKNCCEKCFENLKAEETGNKWRNREQSEAEYQIESRWGI